MQIRTHKYAEKAYPKVAEVIHKSDEIQKKYRTLALNIPTMIMQSGLAQAIGFLMAKDEEEHRLVLQHIEQVLEHKMLHQAILKSDITEYQFLTRQTLEATSWLKRYTQALLASTKD